MREYARWGFESERFIEYGYIEIEKHFSEWLEISGVDQKFYESEAGDPVLGLEPFFIRLYLRVWWWGFNE